ncbi:MAG: TIGR03364 family FAD-dependent oxidoreductase [Pirellulales bacterium]|nr:TIGR03364 family FAD-dependent oxidoreductase [Pirellulales bacterium]
MPQKIAIVGAGIVGLSQAWLASEQGHQVTIFERNHAAIDASIRNFGMIWPIGQTPGLHYQTALRSRARWLKFAAASGLWIKECGTIHLAHRPDEWQVLREFAELAPDAGISCELLSREGVLSRTPAANPDGLLGGLWSSTELCVNPRVAISALASWLQATQGIKIHFSTPVVAATPEYVQTATGQKHSFDQLLVCSGADIQTLFPQEFANTGLKLCKIQMLRTVPQPANWWIGPHLASGLTLRHYASFGICPSLPQLRARIASETPELDQWGIHVMASQHETGEVTLGDSHEYGADITPFEKSSIDDAMLRELHKIITLPTWQIQNRWVGLYAKNTQGLYWQAQPFPNIRLLTGMGGAGMTMSLGIAERNWQEGLMHV